MRAYIPLDVFQAGCIAPAHLPVTGNVDIDPTVLGFTSIVGAGAALLAGLLPALLTSQQRGNVAGSLGNRALGGRMLAQFQQTLTVVQVALGLGLLAVAGLLTQSLLRLSSVNPGFRTEGVIGFELSIPSNHSSTAKQLIQRMLEETRSIPGVLSAGWITNLPPETRQGMFLQFSIAGPAAQASRTRPICNFQATSEDYFQTVGVPLVRGRDFTSADAIGAPPVVIVNETFARHFFGPADALGQSIISLFDSKDASRRIVGIIRDMRDRGLKADPVATAYIPYGQWVPGFGSIAVRSSLQPEAIIPEIRRRMTRIEPTVPLKSFTTIKARIHKSLGEPRFYALLAGSCGLMAVLFVTLGLYGVVSYSVSRRTAEIGLRMALGAPKPKILRGVLWQGLWMAGIGVAIGLPLSLAASRVLTNLLFQVKPNDPATLGMAAGLVVMVTLAASYIPARRASRVDPMVALRHE
jgi:putative ABC transport system permease protein